MADPDQYPSGTPKINLGLRLVNNTISSQSQRLVSSVPSDTAEREMGGVYSPST